jgi:hypothetical protein
MSITISTSDLNLIKKVIGHPFIELPGTLTLPSDEEIIEYCVTEPLRDYFRKFPIQLQTQTAVSAGSGVTIDFPEDDVYGVLNMQIVGKEDSRPGSLTSFYTLYAYNQGYARSGYGGSYGIVGYNPNNVQASYINKRYEYGSLENQFNTNDMRIDDTNRKVVVNSLQSGYALITWGLKSEDFNLIFYERKNDVIKLCQAQLLYHTADAIELLSDSQLEVNFNPTVWRDKAEKLEEEVKERWADIPEVVYYKST